LPHEYEGIEHKIVLPCTQDMLNTFLINVDDGNGVILETILKKYLKNKVKVDIMITIKKLLKMETLIIDNLIIFAKEIQKDSNEEDLVVGFIEKIGIQ
jgi:hypothetical protein